MNDEEHTDRHDEDPSQSARSQGPGSEGSGSQESQRPAAPQPREIHRERETIVAGGGRPCCHAGSCLREVDAECQIRPLGPWTRESSRAYS